jgi:hypothetical protein
MKAALVYYRCFGLLNIENCFRRHFKGYLSIGYGRIVAYSYYGMY